MHVLSPPNNVHALKLRNYTSEPPDVTKLRLYYPHFYRQLCEHQNFKSTYHFHISVTS